TRTRPPSTGSAPNWPPKSRPVPPSVTGWTPPSPGPRPAPGPGGWPGWPPRRPRPGRCAPRPGRPAVPLGRTRGAALVWLVLAAGAGLAWWRFGSLAARIAASVPAVATAGYRLVRTVRDARRRVSETAARPRSWLEARRDAAEQEIRGLREKLVK